MQDYCFTLGTSFAWSWKLRDVVIGMARLSEFSASFILREAPQNTTWPSASHDIREEWEVSVLSSSNHEQDIREKPVFNVRVWILKEILWRSMQRCASVKLKPFIQEKIYCLILLIISFLISTALSELALRKQISHSSWHAALYMRESGSRFDKISAACILKQCNLTSERWHEATHHLIWHAPTQNVTLCPWSHICWDLKCPLAQSLFVREIWVALIKLTAYVVPPTFTNQ